MKSNTPSSVLRAMASASSPDSDVSSTTVQVTSIGGQQIFQSGKGQQYLIVNQALQGSGGRIQIVTSDKQETSGETVLGESILLALTCYLSYLYLGFFRCNEETGDTCEAAQLLQDT